MWNVYTSGRSVSKGNRARQIRFVCSPNRLFYQAPTTLSVLSWFIVAIYILSTVHQPELLASIHNIVSNKSPTPSVYTVNTPVHSYCHLKWLFLVSSSQTLPNHLQIHFIKQIQVPHRAVFTSSLHWHVTSHHAFESIQDRNKPPNVFNGIALCGLVLCVAKHSPH